jgi:hypothetical protein
MWDLQKGPARKATGIAHLGEAMLDDIQSGEYFEQIIKA